MKQFEEPKMNLLKIKMESIADGDETGSFKPNISQNVEGDEGDL